MKLKAKYSICLNEVKYEVVGLLKTTYFAYWLIDANILNNCGIVKHDELIGFNHIIFKKCKKYHYRDCTYHCIASKDLENALIKFKNET